MRSILQRFEVFIAVFYFITFALVLAPYYNWLYRVMVNSLHAVSFWGALIVLTLMLTSLYIRRRFRRVALITTLGLLILFVGSQAHNWRYYITDKYIKSSQCEVSTSTGNGLILGGIREIRVDEIERTGAFENDSHCLFAYCTEEFYYCDGAAVTIGQ